MFYTHMEMDSDLSKLSEIEVFIQSLLHDFKMEPQYCGILSTPLLEAVKNAIIHGNQADPHKKVRILCQYDDDRWTFSVKDEGNGFDFEQYLQQRILGLSHGLSIIFTLCDSVEFQNNGSVISFSIRLPKQKQETQQREWAQKVMKQYLPQLV